MNYILKDDHTIKKVKEIKKTDCYNMKYALLDISTDRKGPVFTVVKSLNFDFKSDLIDILMDTSYAVYDLPYEIREDAILSSRHKISTINNYYNIYPLIKQIFAFNNFIEVNSSLDSQLFIQQIQIGYNGNVIEISEKDSDTTIKKIFKKLNMVTNTEEVLLDRFLIIYKDTWDVYSFRDYNPLEMNFDKIGIMIPDTESLYLMSYKEFHLFNKLKSLELEFQYEIDNPNSLFEEFDDIDESISILSVSSFIEYLELFIFIPQLILMEKAVYNNEVNIRLSVETKKDMYSLIIDHKETNNPKHTCMYYIIKKLLKM